MKNKKDFEALFCCFVPISKAYDKSGGNRKFNVSISFDYFDFRRHMILYYCRNFIWYSR